MRTFNGLEELKAAVGTEIGTSHARSDQQATCDEQWIHVDQERAKVEMPGGKTIAHGLLSLSLTLMFVRSVMGL